MSSDVPSPIRPLILVVEKFEDARELSAEFLRDSGFEVATAGDGPDAVTKASQLHPALIVLDLVLPVFDGWEAIRRLQADDRTRLIPLLITTGHKSSDDRVRSERLGCAGYLERPCSPVSLVEKIRHVLGRTRLPEA